MTIYLIAYILESRITVSQVDEFDYQDALTTCPTTMQGEGYLMALDLPAPPSHSISLDLHKMADLYVQFNRRKEQISCYSN